MSQADFGVETLRGEVDTLIVIPNDRLLSLSDENISFVDAFRQADHVLLQGVSGITDLITTPGLINLDFADVKSVMQGAGTALMGIGSARGTDRALEAAERAIASPLLEAGIDGAHGVLLSVSGGSNLGLFEINEAARHVADAVHPDANIIFGAVIDDTLGDEVRVTVIAAGFDRVDVPTRKPEAPAQRRSEESSSLEAPRARPARDIDVPDFVTRGRRVSLDDTGDLPRADGSIAELEVPPARREKPRKIVFEDLEDELDIPDFLK